MAGSSQSPSPHQTSNPHQVCRPHFHHPPTLHYPWLQTASPVSTADKYPPWTHLNSTSSFPASNLGHSHHGKSGGSGSHHHPHNPFPFPPTPPKDTTPETVTPLSSQQEHYGSSAVASSVNGDDVKPPLLSIPHGGNGGMSNSLKNREGTLHGDDFYHPAEAHAYSLMPPQHNLFFRNRSPTAASSSGHATTTPHTATNFSSNSSSSSKSGASQRNKGRSSAGKHPGAPRRRRPRRRAVGPGCGAPRRSEERV